MTFFENSKAPNILKLSVIASAAWLSFVARSHNVPMRSVLCESEKAEWVRKWTKAAAVMTSAPLQSGLNLTDRSYPLILPNPYYE